MIYIGICTADTDTAITLKQLASKLGKTDTAIRFYSNDLKYDVVLITPSACVAGLTIAAKHIIVPDCLDLNEISGELGKNVIGYGLLPKNTVTASSITQNCMSVAIQRKYTTVCGKTIGEQEFIIRSGLCAEPEKTLGIISTLLVLGVSPEELSAI